MGCHSPFTLDYSQTLCPCVCFVTEHADCDECLHMCTRDSWCVCGVCGRKHCDKTGSTDWILLRRSGWCIMVMKAGGDGLPLAIHPALQSNTLPLCVLCHRALPRSTLVVMNACTGAPETVGVCAEYAGGCTAIKQDLPIGSCCAGQDGVLWS